MGSFTYSLITIMIFWFLWMFIVRRNLKTERTFKSCTYISLESGIVTVGAALLISLFLKTTWGFSLSVDNGLTVNVLGLFFFAMTEEICKLAMGVLMFMRSRSTNNNDAILFILLSALGFSFIENVVYSLGAEEPLLIGLMRSVLCLAGHVSFSSLSMLGWIISRGRGVFQNVPICSFYLIVGTISHSLFNSQLSVLFSYSVALGVIIFCPLIIIGSLYLASEIIYRKKLITLQKIVIEECDTK